MFPDASRAPASGAVIPIRAFALGKARLAASLDGAERAALGRRWAEQVVHAAAPMPVVVAHADLPRAEGLARLARDGAQPIVALVPCHRDDGTPVLSIPTAVDFRFAYGPDSFRRHAAEARRLGLGLRVVRDADLAFDVDIPDDLAALDTAIAESAAT